MVYTTLASMGRYIPKYDEYGDLNDVDLTDLVENFN